MYGFWLLNNLDKYYINMRYGYEVSGRLTFKSGD